MKACEDWNKKWGLFFNSKKCEYVIIGNKKTDIDLDIKLYEQNIASAKFNRVLGLVIENMKNDPLWKMES